MSFHVYIARDGWKETPITPEEWRAASSAMAQLRIREIGRAKPGLVYAQLRDHKRQSLSLMEGFVHAQDPKEELVEVMFAIAEMLDARVFSERAIAYASVADWRTRTKKYRGRLAKRKAEYRKKRDRKRLLIILWVATCLAAGLTLAWLMD